MLQQKVAIEATFCLAASVCISDVPYNRYIDIIIDIAIMILNI